MRQRQLDRRALAHARSEGGEVVGYGELHLRRPHQHHEQIAVRDCHIRARDKGAVAQLVFQHLKSGGQHVFGRLFLGLIGVGYEEGFEVFVELGGDERGRLEHPPMRQAGMSVPARSAM